MGGLVAVAVIFAVLFGLLIGSVTDPDPNPTYAPSSAASTPVSRATSSTPAPSRSLTSPSPQRPSSAPPATQPAPSRQAPPPTQRPHPPGDYNHDGYPVPGIEPGNAAPYPNTRQEGKAWSEANAFYLQSINPPVRCEVDVIDFDKASDAERNRQIAFLRDCLQRVWAPAVANAGWYLTAPESYIAYRDTNTPCGKAKPGWAAFYCPSNQTIYMLVEPHRTVKMSNGALLPYFELTYTHEFGHHIQERTGILGGSWSQVFDGDQALKEYRSRRVELQAQCLSGMSIQSLTYGMGFSDFDKQQMYKFESGRNPDAEHSTSELQGAWWWQGMKFTEIRECNTFRADPKYIDP